MSRLTEKMKMKNRNYTYKGLNPTICGDIIDKLGKLEDLEEEFYLLKEVLADGKE